MKKILILSLVLGVMLAIAGVATAKNQEQKLGFPKNAVEVSPGVFYLGQSMDKGQVVEGYAFVHYAKDSKQAKAAKPVWDDTVDIYKLLFGGIKWADTMTYEVNPDGSGLNNNDVMVALGASLDTWDTAITGEFELFDDELGTTTKGFNSGDRVNRVTWDDLSEIFGANVIAANYFWFNPATKEMVESDVVFSTGFTWSVDETCDGNWMDLQNIATHEFGHNGLNDLYSSPSVKLTMHGISYGYCETHKRDLGTGDISGIRALYGE